MQQNSFLDILFPPDISSGAIGGPEFFTSIALTKGKSEFRNSNWEIPRRKYIVSYKNKSTAEIESLVSFFHVCQGRNIAFRYKDWSDYTASNALVGTADGTVNEFQLKKHYKFDAFSFTRIITKPVPNTLEVFINGASLKNEQFNPNYITGTLSFLNTPVKGDIITASFEFHVPVRFDTDFLPIKTSSANDNDIENITLKEVNL